MTSTSAKFARLSLDNKSSVARITLANPPLNIIDIPMMDELAAVISEVESQPEISAVIFSGEGRDFSAGVDIAAHAPETIADMLGKFHSVIRSLLRMRPITIAVVRGRCLGGGAELAMICDIVVTAESAEWGFPEIALGCFPPIACTALSALTGPKRAHEMILTGRTFGGVEAASSGIATSAVPAEKVNEEVANVLDRFAKLSSAALAITKKAIYAWDSMHFDKGLARAEQIYMDDLMKTDDAQEGIRAFLEKRNPQWKGR
jgi:cyclohexa-1,5-dienecarbonyl-CoA hydratase